MAETNKTLASTQRIRLIDAYRGRGKKNNSLWLVYSVKTNRDWILTSDRQLVHWIVFLETCSDVRKFGFEDEGYIEEKNVVKVLVETCKSGNEIHTIRCKDVAQIDKPKSLKRNVILGGETLAVREFSDHELKPVVPEAMRWLKALAFAAVMRDMEQTSLQASLFASISFLKQGVVRQIVESLSDFEEPLVLGMLVRFAIQHYVELDLKGNPFSYMTPWRLRNSNG